MGFYGRLQEKKAAQDLRRKGLSYKEILQEINVSKDTISRWCRDIKLTKKQQLRLMSKKIFGQKKGSLIAAENKRRIRLQRIEEYKKIAKKELGELKDREKFIFGLALYAAEGNKTGRQVAFTNSDPKMIKFMMIWFLRYLKIPIDRFRGAIWLHEELDENRAKTFWSKLTNIPIENFHKTYVAKNKINSNKIRKNVHQYGIFSIRLSDSDRHRKVMGWISAVLGDKIDVYPR